MSGNWNEIGLARKYKCSLNSGVEHAGAGYELTHFSMHDFGLSSAVLPQSCGRCERPRVGVIQLLADRGRGTLLFWVVRFLPTE